MAEKENFRTRIRNSRKTRIRKKISGTGERPRLSVRRSLNHIYAQLVDDVTGQSMLQISSLSGDIRTKAVEISKIEVSKAVGKRVGEEAISKGIKKIIFDRGGNLYHGRVKALADGVREAGLEF